MNSSVIERYEKIAVLEIEVQQKIHYAMPLRTLLYDGMGYLKEYQEISRLHKEEKGSMISVIGKITDSGELMRQGNNKEVANMCTALEKLKDEGRQEGIQSGRLDMIRHAIENGATAE